MVEQETTIPYTAISRKVVGKSASDNPERYCGGFEFTVLQRNLKQWHEGPWTYTFFKERCRREGRMAIVERRLYDRKEPWVLNIDGQ